MDPRTGKILDRLGPALGVETPDDVTFGPPGSTYENDIFWTALFTGEVGRLTPDGTKITAGQVFPGVNPITFSDDGRLFVAHDFFGFSVSTRSTRTASTHRSSWTPTSTT